MRDAIKPVLKVEQELQLRQGNGRGSLVSRKEERKLAADGQGTGKCGWNHSAIARGILLIEFCGALTLFAVAALLLFFPSFSLNSYINIYFFLLCLSTLRGLDGC